MEEKDDTTQNTSETNEPMETEENADEINKQDTEDNKSEDEEQEMPQQEEVDDKISVAETVADDIDDEQDDYKAGSKDNRESDFELQDINQLTEEQKAEMERAEQEKLKQMDELFENAEVSSEDEDEEEEQEEEEEEDEREEDEARARLMSHKDSVFGEERGSIIYEMGPRIRDAEDTQIDTGDFVLLEEDVPFKFYKYMDEKDDEEGQEESVTEEEELLIDRIPFYEKYELIMGECTVEKIRNNLLQKRLAKFFKRRKMDHVLKETDQQFDTQEKYGKKLDAYGELSELDNSQRTAINSELENLKSERESKFHELLKLFEDLQTQEKDTGYGLIHTKTGKPIPDKLVERLIHRQKHQMQTIGDMRMRYLQLKSIVAEKQNAISQLDKIGENLYLMDYEQLKVENRSYMDKMEEKDEELSRLRNKCQKTIQILAHMREKSSALETDICDLSDDLLNLEQNCLAVRGNLNKLKQQRDYYRNTTNKLRDESGLLTESELLRDMEISMRQLKSMSEELESLKEDHKIKAQQIRNIRKNIEFPPEGLIKKAPKIVSDKATHGRHLYKGRPSIHKPTVPDDAFKHLKNFKGKPTFDTLRKRYKM